MEQMKNSLVFFMLLLAMIAALTTISASNNTAQKQLATVMRASSGYNSVSDAYSKGYVQASDCVPGQGYYFVNYNYVRDNSINILEPDVLLFEKGNNGLHFVGFQYVMPYTASGEVPNYFGQDFSGPVDGYIRNEGSYYYLNVWMRKVGKGGRFADYNEKVTCN